jgi:nickel transport protein
VRARPLVIALAVAFPLCAAAHEVLHDVERGRAIAVHAYLADGEDLAYREYEVFAPSEPRVPHQKGRTDRKGWLAFVPDTAGTWRVRISDETGHGLELAVDAAMPAAPSGGAPSTWSFVLRPLAGVLAICAVFAALFAVYRRRAGS